MIASDKYLFFLQTSIATFEVGVITDPVTVSTTGIPEVTGIGSSDGQQPMHPSITHSLVNGKQSISEQSQKAVPFPA